ncbi:ankyrin repeat domain-containing protein [Archangium violaceum]|uniref:ankyrin repeat domain-containing protein n=1 Tax=Archangium violaceum TaxID=83451 RepID=UPI00193B7D18|nr:ankyrin repeat domain-containing protein [Archangium violaceum]QRK04910.1 ankyrin repeat domain-containing protein [Archangium violaceum]
MSKELFTAIKQHDTSRIKALLAEGADPNEPQSEPPGLRPLHVAIYELADGGELDVILALLKHGADVNAWDVERDRTPLLVAVCENELAAADALVKAGAEPNVRSSDGITPLRSSVEDGNLDMASLLLEAGATKTINDWGGLLGFTALGIAIWQLDIPMMKLLLDAGADPEAPDDSRRPTRERLPPRDDSDPQKWDAAFELLKEAKGRNP